MSPEQLMKGKVDAREEAPTSLNPRVTQGVSSHSPSGKITSSRAASGHQSKRISLIDHSTEPTTTSAYSHSAARRRATSKAPVNVMPRPTMA